MSVHTHTSKYIYFTPLLLLRLISGVCVYELMCNLVNVGQSVSFSLFVWILKSFYFHFLLQMFTKMFYHRGIEQLTSMAEFKQGAKFLSVFSTLLKGR